MHEGGGIITRKTEPAKTPGGGGMAIVEDKIIRINDENLAGGNLVSLSRDLVKAFFADYIVNDKHISAGRPASKGGVTGCTADML